jgi:hypothetical protein
MLIWYLDIGGLSSATMIVIFFEACEITMSAVEFETFVMVFRYDI